MLDMKDFVLVMQIILSVFLIAAILLQSQGTGLGSVWGGGGENYHTKRGVERVLLYLTGILIFAFAIATISSGVLI